MEEYLTLAVRKGNLIHYHTCEDEEYNAEYLHHIGFSWELAIEISAWATMAPEGDEYIQDEFPSVEIYIV